MNRNSILLTLFIILVPVSLFPFGKNKVNYENFQWKILNTVHFDIHYTRGMEEVAFQASKIAEEAYVHLSDYLNHELTEIIPVIIYPSPIAFQNNNILPYVIGEGTGGFTEVLKNRVVIPFNGSYPDLRHVLTHELTHAFQFNILFYDTSGEIMSKFSSHRVPLWFMEGMSEYLSIGFDETVDMVMRDALFNENYVTLKNLTLLRLNNIYMLYKEGQAFFYFLEKKYGREVMGELFRDIRDLNDLDEAFKASTGKTMDELNTEWIRFFKKRYFHLVSSKNFDDSEGERLTDHEKTRSSINLCPAVSPDGKKIAYLTNRDIYASLVIAEVAKKKERVITPLIRGNTRTRFQGMHLMSNNLTWSRDGKQILFVAQANCRDVIYLVDSKKGRVQKRIVLPMRAISDPSLSRDGTRIVFSGLINDSSDIYLYTIKTGELVRVTSDPFTDRYPRVLSDNRTVLFSTNWNSSGDIESRNYNIFSVDTGTGKRKPVVVSDGNDIQFDMSGDEKSLVYVSDMTGIYNIYIHDIEKGKSSRATDVLSGVFYPRWFPGENRIAFVAYQKSGYDIFIKDINKSGLNKEVNNVDTEHEGVSFTETYLDPGDYRFSDYRSRLSPDWFILGLTGTYSYGFVGFVQMTLSDYLGNHSLRVMSNFVRQDRENDVNYNISYLYLKNRLDYGIGLFRQKNPYWIYSLSDINDLIHNVNFGTIYMNYYGGYGIASYPVSRYFRVNMKATASRFERDYSIYDTRKDVFANLNQLSFSLSYDNVLWGRMVPADGMRGVVGFEHAFDISGQDYSYSSVDFDIRKYFLISKRYVFALRGSGGKVFGRDNEYFRYYIGGFSTLRGHGFLDYAGRNMLLGNIEFRFTFIEGIKFGWPLFFGIGNIGGVLFTDFGSAWDNDYIFVNRDTGEFEDFKVDCGFGFRFTIYPVIILKLDYAWPYNKKSFGDREFIFSLGFEY